MNNGNHQFYHREGNGPEIDITEQLKTDYQTNIDSHKRWIKIIDEQIASGR
ncbi:hypothetical protein ABIC60_003734 [Phyllobacterium ifriqiyense]